MRHSDCRRIACVIAGFLAIAATAEGLPILPADISVGAGVTGSLSFLVSSSPPDQDPSARIGRYVVADSTAQMVIRVGGVAFASNPDGLVVEVCDCDGSLNADYIFPYAEPDETTFPFLTSLPRQNPNLDPVGFLLLGFWLPPTQFSSDAFPTSIDPLAAVPIPPFITSGIFGRAEGVSRQTPTNAFVEWGFYFNIDPLSMNFVLNGGVLNSPFSGTINLVNPGDSTGFEPVPEPSSFILVMSGLLALRKLAGRRHLA
jgi:hypothetical protein